MISPKTTIPMVAPMTATNPEVSVSRRMVKVLLTSTLPSRRAQRRKLPCFLMGKILLAYFRSLSVPVF